MEHGDWALIMEKRKVQYYVHEEFDAGLFDTELENPKETDEGYSHGIVYEPILRDDIALNTSRILLERVNDGKIILVEPKQLIRFIE